MYLTVDNKHCKKLFPLILVLHSGFNAFLIVRWLHCLFVFLVLFLSARDSTVKLENIFLLSFVFFPKLLLLKSTLIYCHLLYFHFPFQILFFLLLISSHKKWLKILTHWKWNLFTRNLQLNIVLLFHDLPGYQGTSNFKEAREM